MERKVDRGGGGEGEGRGGAGGGRYWMGGSASWPLDVAFWLRTFWKGGGSGGGRYRIGLQRRLADDGKRLLAAGRCVAASNLL